MAKEKNIHEGHRKRLRQSVDRDCELEALSDIEVLEYLLTFLIPRKDTNPIAHALLDHFGSIYGVLSASSQELFEIKNMTEMAAHLIPNLSSIVRRAGISRIRRSAPVRFTEDAVNIFRPYFINRNAERLYMMCIDLHDRLMQIDLLSEGSASSTAVDVSKIVAIISRIKPSKVIIAHNHPNGNISPSSEDLSMTETLAILLGTISVKLVDHIVFAGDNYFSFYEHDMTTESIRKVDKISGTSYYKEVRDRKDNKRYMLEDKQEE